ncbi:DUF6124 family protein [Pseudomonas citri]|uniref:DUF6124 family protein n=1 Tax=Pseudomonas citri TaxID=2978349 RepID=UPI0021B6E6EE|nr:DUF6124 family protein [Pseudomonas citri]
MFKPTPNPPEIGNSSSQTKSNAKKHDEATKRALDFYLLPKPTNPEDEKPGRLFTVVSDIDNESLLANLTETLASADAMVSDLAFDLEGSRRHVALGIQQLIELSSLLAGRALDNVDLR